MSDSPFPVVILAGGLATRLHPVTEHIPKSLIEVCGEPFLAHQLRYLKTQNIFSVVMCLGYLGNMIQDFLKGDEWHDMQFSFSFDGSPLLGTGGAIRKALPYLPQAFFVLYGDSYLPCNFQDVQRFYLQSKKQALMTVFENNGQWDSSNVCFQNGQIFDYNKKIKTNSMKHIDYGLGIFSKDAFLTIEENKNFDLSFLYQDLLLKNELAAFEVKERFYEVGSFSGISELSLWFSKRNNQNATKMAQTNS